MCTHTWNDLTTAAHALIVRPSRRDLTPAVTLMQSLHRQTPATPEAICSHLEPGSKALASLAAYAQSGDRHALLMAAVIMRHSLRRISGCADPDGYRSTDAETRANDTLAAFFSVIRTAADTRLITPKYLYWQTLKRVIATRPQGSTGVPLRVSPDDHRLDSVDVGAPEAAKASEVLAQARAGGVITALEYETLKALYINVDRYSLACAATELGARPGAVERRAQRAIRKLVNHTSRAAA